MTFPPGLSGHREAVSVNRTAVSSMAGWGRRGVVLGSWWSMLLRSGADEFFCRAARYREARYRVLTNP